MEYDPSNVELHLLLPCDCVGKGLMQPFPTLNNGTSHHRWSLSMEMTISIIVNAYMKHYCAVGKAYKVVEDFEIQYRIPRQKTRERALQT